MRKTWKHLYSRGNTHLSLSEKAEKAYTETDPLDFEEREILEELEDGTCRTVGYEYHIIPEYISGNWISEKALNEFLEALCDL